MKKGDIVESLETVGQWRTKGRQYEVISTINIDGTKCVRYTADNGTIKRGKVNTFKLVNSPSNTKKEIGTLTRSSITNAIHKAYNEGYYKDHSIGTNYDPKEDTKKILNELLGKSK